MTDILNIITESIAPSIHSLESVESYQVDTDSISPSIQPVESHLVDAIRVYYDELEHIKLNSLCDFLRLEILQRGIIGEDINNLAFYCDKNFILSDNNCLLSDISFTVEGDLYERKFDLINQWPNSGYTLPFKVEEGIKFRKLLDLDMEQRYIYLVTDKPLPSIPSGETNNNLLINKSLPSIPSGESHNNLLINKPLPSIPNEEVIQSLESQSLPVYTDSDNHRNYLPDFEETEDNLLVTTEEETPNERVLALMIEANGPTCLATKLEYQTDWSRVDIQNSTVNSINQSSDID